MRESILQEDSSVVKPKTKIRLEKKDSMQSEKQISVDPISLRESSANMHHPPKMEVVIHNLLPPAGKSSCKFVSCSLPNSASSSPTPFRKNKKKFKNHDGRVVSPLSHQHSPLSRQHSVALSNLERLRESHLRRSKSCGEGRACQPSVDFDLWPIPHQISNGTQDRADEENHEKIIVSHKKKLEVESYEDKFKCGACLFLPGFGGKGKAVRARKEVEAERGMGHADVVLGRMSLEKFECGSWRSSAVINIEEDAGDIFFDLPVELIRCSSVNDTVSPVTTGFIFDNNNNKDQQNHHHLKGVLKNTTTVTTSSGQLYRRKSPESCSSSRHVRFSTSSPTLGPTSPTSSCITPRLCKARDDFSAFLEAQS